MADVIKSRKSEAQQLARDLKRITLHINHEFIYGTESPLTITLGDEFQGIYNHVEKAIEIIISIEEFIITNEMNIKLRYVAHQGEISTRINHKMAHGMLGKGLTHAREELNKMKKGKDRFKIIYEKPKRYNELFVLYQSFVDSWKEKDLKYVNAFIKHQDYKQVAEATDKTISQMWKREKSLHIREYGIIKSLILQND